MTSDGVPILYHDENFNTRLVSSEYLVGPVGNYTYRQIQTLGRLIHGEQIPTLDQVLSTIVQKTSLNLVWLDVKDASMKDTIVALQQKYTELAQSTGRNLEILFGVPDETVYKSLKADSRCTQIPSVCELGVAETEVLNSQVYAPRWTLGTLNEEVKDVQKKGRRAFVWTLDQPEFISKFFEEGSFDGMLTNYPTLVAYHYYSGQ
jgi:glycerophosphoryl diester phosphodiesterase